MTILLANASSAGAGIFVLFLFVAGIGFYFVPTIVAFGRNKSNKIPILVLNFFLGWSLIGWVVSLVWALSQDQQPVIVHQTFQSAGPPLQAPGDSQTS